MTPTDIINVLQKYRIMPNLVRELIVDQVIAAFPEPSDEQKKALIEHEHKNNRIPKDLTADQLDFFISRRLKIEEYKKQTYSHQLEDHFLKRKPQLDQVVFSLIRTNNAAIAQELFFRIQEGEQTFAELAKTFSIGQEGANGGLVGPLSVADLNPRLNQLLRSCKPGELKPPVQIDNVYLVVRLEKMIPAQLDELMEQKLLQELFEMWLHKKIEEELSKLTLDRLSELMNLNNDNN